MSCNDKDHILPLCQKKVVQYQCSMTAEDEPYSLCKHLPVQITKMDACRDDQRVEAKDWIAKQATNARYQSIGKPPRH